VAGMLLRRGIGRVSVEAARIFAQTDSRFIRPDPNGSLITTREVLAEERRTVERCRDGQGAHEAMGRGQAWEIGSEVVRKERRAIPPAVLPELLRSPGWINNAHQTWTLSNWLS
jgi:hypothetical protein